MKPGLFFAAIFIGLICVFSFQTEASTEKRHKQNSSPTQTNDSAQSQSSTKRVTAPVKEASDETPEADEDLETKQEKHRDLLKQALATKDPKFLEKLKDIEGLNEALEQDDLEKLGEIFGLDNSEKELHELRARYLVETDIDKFYKAYRKLENSKNPPSTDYERALAKETRKLVEKHAPLTDFLESRTGAQGGDLAIRLEKWDRMLASGEGEKAAKNMAGFIRSTRDRKGLKAALASIGDGYEKTAVKRHLEWAVDHMINPTPSAQQRLLNHSNSDGDKLSTEFTDSFRKVWPQHVQAAKRYRELRDSAVIKNSDGSMVVNDKGLEDLKKAFPGLTSEWAHAMGDSKSLWASGWDKEAKRWSFTGKQDISTALNLAPTTLFAGNSKSLEQFIGWGENKATIGKVSLSMMSSKANLYQTEQKNQDSIQKANSRISSAGNLVSPLLGPTSASVLTLATQSLSKKIIVNSNLGTDPISIENFNSAIKSSLPQSNATPSHTDNSELTTTSPPLKGIQKDHTDSPTDMTIGKILSRIPMTSATMSSVHSVDGNDINTKGTKVSVFLRGMKKPKVLTVVSESPVEDDQRNVITVLEDEEGLKYDFINPPLGGPASSLRAHGWEWRPAPRSKK